MLEVAEKVGNGEVVSEREGYSSTCEDNVRVGFYHYQMVSIPGETYPMLPHLPG